MTNKHIDGNTDNKGRKISKKKFFDKIDYPTYRHSKREKAVIAGEERKQKEDESER